ncbi:MATE family efflux transporter [Novosphingobium mathurense]|uniref:Putative efflux protein, MATE family n=1 Tax=Novosphingobium mathurense TaxID=428990 RepID=A0A1U6GSV3_9SPHN|nr:MATE family efflux transporter [Novosphingobium mathurense]SLJ86615.1 putative efflux protein, MATE family [Novosphingobium mathurense]
MSEAVPMEAEALAERTPGKTERGDLTQGPILRTLLLFSLPMLLSNVLQTLNGSINTIWVGRLLGESALAATANANLVMFLVIAATIGLGMATTVRVGQHFGARDIQALRATFGTGLGLCMALSAVTGALGWIFSPALLNALATPEASVKEALAYLRVIFVTVPFGVMSMVISMALRGAGDSRTPLYAMILTVMLDIVLNPLLIMGLGPVPSLGIAGSAMATAFANFSGTLFQIRQIYRKDLPLRLRGAELRYVFPRSEELRYIVTKGVPMGAQMLLFSSAGVIMIGLVNREGLNAAAAYGASLQLWNYLQMPAFAVGSAVSAMVAQTLGAGNHARVGAVTRVGVLSNLAMTTTLAAIIVLADHPLLALFLGGNSPAMPIAERIQLICTCAYLFMSVTMILSGTMRAYGAVVAPLVIMAIALYPARLGFYYALYPQIGGDAVWWAFPVGGMASMLLTIAYYTKGNWRRALAKD